MPESNLTSRLAEAFWNKRHPEWAVSAPDRVRPHVVISPRALPRYGYDRATVRIRDLVRGRQPWITADALELLDQLLRPTDRGLEYGAGGTTTWFAERVEFLDSVEGSDRWHGPLEGDIASKGMDNVTLHLVSKEELGIDSPAHREGYINVCPDLQPESLDFVFVDGEYRDDCALRGVTLLKSGGLLILDNATAYLPADTRSPWRVDKPVSARWEEFAGHVSTWRRIWTTNGVWDTAIWVKP
ncbi:MAG: hypothetical protein JWO11_2954 [Nocardioides sp.]|nr:hypothetical protein [Nocardioides sp.]